METATETSAVDVHARLYEILGLLRRVRAEVGEGSAGERLKVIEKALCQLEAELRDPKIPTA